MEGAKQEEANVSEMVERVARALSIADGNHPDACSNDDDQIPAWTLYEDDARTAIEAMREPTTRMIGASVKCNADPEMMLHKQRWQAMIDAALK